MDRRNRLGHGQRKEIAAPSQDVTVDLGASYANVAVYDPMVGTSPVATYSQAESLHLTVVDHPLIVQVTP